MEYNTAITKKTVWANKRSQCKREHFKYLEVQIVVTFFIVEGPVTDERHALERLRQKGHEFQASLYYIVRPCLKI
jgi:hypothetical protein